MNGGWADKTAGFRVDIRKRLYNLGDFHHGNLQFHELLSPFVAAVG
jgi:hypothetical protein